MDYLADRICAEAARENVSLSDVERKMLYFSETDWTLPDMASVSAEFDRHYDADEYEGKISGLVREIEADSHENDREKEQEWDAAVKKLSEGDRYLLVLLNPLLLKFKPAGRPPHDRLKLWLTAFGIVFGLFILIALYNWLLSFSTSAGRLFGNQSRMVILLVGAVALGLAGPRLWAALRMFLNRS